MEIDKVVEATTADAELGVLLVKIKDILPDVAKVMVEITLEDSNKTIVSG